MTEEGKTKQEIVDYIREVARASGQDWLLGFAEGVESGRWPDHEEQPCAYESLKPDPITGEMRPMMLVCTCPKCSFRVTL